jgi:hypothetical protein
MHQYGDWASEQWPDETPDPDWPDDWAPSAGSFGGDRPAARGVPAQGVPGRRTLALALTATIALGAGAGAVYLYKSAMGGSTPSANAPGASSTAAPGSPAGGGTVTTVELLGQVLAVGSDTVTVGGGPVGSIRARVTSATRFTGADGSLAQVRVGDTVAVQITESRGVASVVTLQDPASQ